MMLQSEKNKQDRYLGNENELVNKLMAERTLPPGTYTLRFKASAENMSMSKITQVNMVNKLLIFMRSSLMRTKL